VAKAQLLTIHKWKSKKWILTFGRIGSYGTVRFRTRTLLAGERTSSSSMGRKDPYSSVREINQLLFGSFVCRDMALLVSTSVQRMEALFCLPNEQVRMFSSEGDAEVPRGRMQNEAFSRSIRSLEGVTHFLRLQNGAILRSWRRRALMLERMVRSNLAGRVADCALTRIQHWGACVPRNEGVAEQRALVIPARTWLYAGI